jgi:hypothetical protein
MRHPELFNPESIAKAQFAIQIVDTHECLETRTNIHFPAGRPRLDRTLPAPKNQQTKLPDGSKARLVPLVET